MRLIIEIEMENAAFEYEPATEAARILRRLAERMVSEGIGAFSLVKLRDVDGNHVGFAKVED